MCIRDSVRGAANSSAIVAAVQTLVQEHTAKLHASHSIADERVPVSYTHLDVYKRQVLIIYI